MTHPSSPLHALRNVQLGDILTLPDGRELTVRSVERQLSTSVGEMAGWVLAGEIGPQATLLSIPTHPAGEVVIYTPLEDVPPHARNARAVVSGVVSYWAPHLPGVSGAMGELGYKVCAIRASRDPMVLVWRGRELVVFVKSACTDASQLGYWFLNRDPEATEKDVTRYSGVVTAPNAPRRQPAPAAPQRERRRVPLLPGRRR